MLHDFLRENKAEILKSTESKSLELAGNLASSILLREGLPIFFNQLSNVLIKEAHRPRPAKVHDQPSMVAAAEQGDEPGIAKAVGRPDEAAVAEEGGFHGKELLRLGYSLSHVVHAYGSMCQAITELADRKSVRISASEFHDLNRCLDVAIAGAVTEFQSLQDEQVSKREVEHLGSLAHELRNALGTVTMALQLIKEGTVGFTGSTGKVLDRGLLRIEELIDRSLTEVRLRVDPKVHLESVLIFHLVDQICVTARIEAQSKNQKIDINIDPKLSVIADKPLIYSAVSNLLQNAIKYTRTGGKIQVRGFSEGEKVKIEIEDECGGLSGQAAKLFDAFEQQNEDRKGLGLGLTIAKRAVTLNKGTISFTDLPGKGCIFRLSLPSTTQIAH